ncbi:cytochrome c biogenesis protein ResB [Micromonospora sp. NBC_01813]|uniref:cytochrome c biogenesis protein ResB n=1 Tax=Micromonospora sp. NBC_01813 TaxID=2975988 RepID=UPI002DDC2E14|nr:cytochrome c biogenesis protein ResB [Micromonospora sp. NBC_01813]WSA07767.1 cytochrome c biogenesis protein ResB [Micromonospora sp. NBC_01813]
MSRPNPGLALLRNSWRQLTSMRTALILLFCLAVAAIPGSLLPQRDVNIENVNAYFQENPRLAPVLDRLGMFDVFASPWFAAIYLLLFTSLVGCIVPRLREHVRALRAAPPATPRRLDRLPQHASWTAGPGETGGVETIAAELRRRRWRVAVSGDTVSAEKGHLKETGNLVFHLSLIAVLFGVALGSWYGWHGNRLLVAGPDGTFCNTVQQYDEYGLGPQVTDTDLPRFCLELTDFTATFLETGQPASYSAEVLVDTDGEPSRDETFSVNSPLRLDGANVYLLGHGYVPVLRYTDRFGQAQTVSAPFLAVDGMLTSEGVASFPDANVDPATGERDPDLQVAFEGLFLPSTPAQPPYVRSTHPELRDPAVMLWAYQGNLGLDAGIPGSVYRIDQQQVTAGRLLPVGEPQLLRIGETMTLDDGTTIEFLDISQYATLSVRYDPGSGLLLASSALLLFGLLPSLFIRRRRVWFRVTPASPDGDSTTGGSSLVEAGGLPRTDHPGFGDEFRELIRAVRGDAGPQEGPH